MNWKKATHIEENKYDLPGDWLKLEYYEAINILFRIENSLRVFVYIVLKNKIQEKWLDLSVTSDDEENSTIQAIAKKRISQDRNYEYLGFLLNSPLVHLTSGELIRIITSDAYWKHFKKYFLGNRDIIKSKLDEIGNVRNSVAHFRPIKIGDVDLIKQNSLHTMTRIEETIHELINCSDIVPSNTEDEWYKTLSNINNTNFAISFKQSKNSDWIKVGFKFNNLLLSKKESYSGFRFSSLNIKPNLLLDHHPELRKYLITITEYNPFIFSESIENINLVKTIFFTFSKEQLIKSYTPIHSLLEEIILDIVKEIDLIKEDHLARGKFVETLTYYVRKSSGSKYYSTNDNIYKTNIEFNNPIEFWGDLNFVDKDFISSTSIFPWLPIEVSEDKGSPF